MVNYSYFFLFIFLFLFYLWMNSEFARFRAPVFISTSFIRFISYDMLFIYIKIIYNIYKLLIISCLIVSLQSYEELSYVDL